MEPPAGCADLYIKVGGVSLVVVRVRQVAPGYLADDLTPGQARELAEALLSAAAHAENDPSREEA